VFAKALFGLPLDAAEVEVFSRHTGRSTAPRTRSGPALKGAVAIFAAQSLLLGPCPAQSVRRAPGRIPDDILNVGEGDNVGRPGSTTAVCLSLSVFHSWAVKYLEWQTVRGLVLRRTPAVFDLEEGRRTGAGGAAGPSPFGKGQATHAPAQS
jgi:hypothetical protein